MNKKSPIVLIITIMEVLSFFFCIFGIEIYLGIYDSGRLYSSISNDKFMEFVQNMDRLSVTFNYIAYFIVLFFIAEIIYAIFWKRDSIPSAVAMVMVSLLLNDFSIVQSDPFFHSILNSSVKETKSLKTKIYMYHYYKIKGNTNGMNMVAKNGTKRLIKEEAILLVKNRKRMTENFYKLK